jgi:hypothetical protein
MSSINQLSPNQLRQAAAIKEKIVALQKQLDQLSGGAVKSAPQAKASKPAKKRRALSAAARAKIAAAQRARWAKVKAAKK